MPLVVPLINGVRHSFASIELVLGPNRFNGFKSINYSRKRARAMVPGNHPDPLAKTRGMNAYSGDCELYLAEFNLFMLSLGGEGHGDIPFMVIASYAEIGMDVVVDELLGCNIDSTEASQAVGPDPLVRKVDLSPLKIRFNGFDDCLVPLIGISF